MINYNTMFNKFDKNHNLSDDSCYELSTQEVLNHRIISSGQDLLLNGKQISYYREAVVYHLSENEIIVVPPCIYPKAKGLLLKSQMCLDIMLNNNYLPIENPEISFLEYEQKRLLNISSNINYFMDVLNKRLRLKYKKIDSKNIVHYYNGILNNIKKGKNQEKELTAYLVMVGEILREARSGRWILELQPATFNPFYEPAIILDDNNIIDISFYVLNRLSNEIEYDESYLLGILNAPSYRNIKQNIELNQNYIILE